MQFELQGGFMDKKCGCPIALPFHGESMAREGCGHSGRGISAGWGGRLALAYILYILVSPDVLLKNYRACRNIRAGASNFFLWINLKNNHDFLKISLAKSISLL
jgi:hypothetical protein